MGEHRGHLERADDSTARDLGRSREGDVLAFVENLAAGRNQELGEQVEAGGLTGPVWADQRMDLAAAYPKVDVARSEEHTSELQSLRHLVCRLLLEKK